LQSYVIVSVLMTIQGKMRYRWIFRSQSL